MTPLRFATLTRLNEADTVLVNLDAIDAMHPCDSGDIGTMLYLRGGDVQRVRESIAEIRETLVDACMDPSGSV